MMTCDGNKGKICKKIFAWFVWICAIKEFPHEIKDVERKERFAWLEKKKFLLTMTCDNNKGRICNENLCDLRVSMRD
jgi:hypothetical protein